MAQLAEMNSLFTGVVASVVVDASRCAVVRHRKSQCQYCVDACGFSAITVDQSGVALDIERCTGCGACVAACALGALSLEQVSVDGALSQAASLTESRQGVAVINCSAVSAEGEAHVPCLAVLGEEALARLALPAQVKHVELHCSGCSTCALSAALPALANTVAAANDLVTSFGGAAEIELQEVQAVSTGSDRRGFVAELGSLAAEAVLGDLQRESAERQKLAVDAEINDAAALYTQMTASFHAHGALNPVSLEGRLALLDAADVLVGSAQNAIAGHRTFASLSVDAMACNGCQVCARFCPTQALRAETGKLLFRAGDCLGCSLCACACPKDVLTLFNQVDVRKLLDVCPEEISIPVRKTYSLPQRKQGSVARKAYEMMGQRPLAFSDSTAGRN